MNSKFSLIVFLYFFLLTTTYSQSYTLSGLATGLGITPPTPSLGSGTISGTYNSTTDMINITISYSGLIADLFNAHIHAGPPGANGPIIVFLNPVTGATSGTISGSFAIPAANEGALIAGNVYVNLHTNDYPSGEIRSQIILTPIVTPNPIAQDIIINEIDITNGWVELHNTSNTTIDVAQLRLCKIPSYANISDLPILNGSTTMTPGSYVVISWSAGISSSFAELGLYKSSGNFGIADNMIDYVKYGSASPVGRASLAVSIGVWDDASKFIPFPTTSTRTLQNFNPAAMGSHDTNSNHWWDGIATQGVVNTCIDNYTIMNATRIDDMESGNADYETDGALESEQVITTGAIVDYDSAQYIELLEKFEVELGAEFLASIDGCNAGMGGLH